MQVRLEEKAALGIALAFGMTAVLGFAVFGLNPQRIAARPDLAGIYAASYAVFSQGQVWVTACAFGWVLTRRVGWRWLSAFAACYAISLFSELAGTTWGLPFGAYSYSSALGPMWLDRVPVIIPISWFLMALPSYALAQRYTEKAGARVALGSLILLAWDLLLDPAMSYVTRYWTWENSGPYFGMPWLNLFGWYVTGIALLAALHALRVGEWTTRFPRSIWILFYIANLLVPAGMVIAAGLS